MIDVAIVGAGPYGLSLAAHLREGGVKYRIFGKPMRFWQDNVPHGTKLKSDGDSSDLIDPRKTLPISQYHAEIGHPFAATTPIPVETFVEYGVAFQQRFVPDVEPCDITHVGREGELFCLTTSANETFLARRVVIAAGINAFRYLPDAFAGLGPEFVTHSAEYGAVDRLAGRRVAVIGSGASAIDVAAVAHEAGADVTIVSSRDHIAFHSPPASRRLRQKIRRPDTGIGAGWAQWFYVNGPDAFRLLPASTRTRIVTTALGPAPGWFMKDRILGHVPVLSGRVPTRATVEAGALRLDLRSKSGPSTSFVVDHVVAATGFHIDMNRLPFLGGDVLAGVNTYKGAPVLSSHFETTMPGLYVVGPASAFSFGPVMRFVYGAGFTTPRVFRHLARQAAASPRQVGSAKVPELAAVR